MAATAPHPELHIDPVEFDTVAKKLREFFSGKGFIEVHTQNRLSIMAACEDPDNISVFTFNGETWALPQTGQMWLEYEYLKNPNAPGYFCISTSYRNEPNPVPGRHDKVFAMAEYELGGSMEDMIKLQYELLEHLGYKPNAGTGEYPRDTYENVANGYKVKELEHEHEEQLYKDHGSTFLVTDFPEYTSPFWNMARNDDGKTAKKVDIIMSGMETIGSAERSCDPEQMRNTFQTIENGGYAGKLYELFGKERVDAELEVFLSNTFIPRSGGGIGMTRLIRSMKMEGLL